MDFKDHWDLDTALQIVRNKTVDSKLWAEAIEWLLLYGPPDVVSILLQASSHATETCFPDLEVADYDFDGSPSYEITQLARLLGITEDEVKDILTSKEREHNLARFFGNSSSGTIH